MACPAGRSRTAAVVDVAVSRSHCTAAASTTHRRRPLLPRRGTGRSARLPQTRRGDAAP